MEMTHLLDALRGAPEWIEPETKWSSQMSEDEFKELGLLVLSRQRDESIRIGDDIEVVVVDLRGEKVRLGIRARKDVSVHRSEVYEQIKREGRAASQLKPEIKTDRELVHVDRPDSYVPRRSRR